MAPKAIEFWDLRATEHRKVKERIERAQREQEVQANRHRNEVSLQAGDYAYVETKGLPKGKDGKLRDPYMGPFKVLEVSPKGVVTMDFPPILRQKKQVNIRRLVKHTGTPPSAEELGIAAGLAATFEVEKIVGHRTGENGQSEYGIRWLGYGPNDDTWQLENDLKEDGLEEMILAYLKKDTRGSQLRGRKRSGRPKMANRQKETEVTGYREIDGPTYRVERGSISRWMPQEEAEKEGLQKKIKEYCKQWNTRHPEDQFDISADSEEEGEYGLLMSREASPRTRESTPGRRTR